MYLPGFKSRLLTIAYWAAVTLNLVFLFALLFMFLGGCASGADAETSAVGTCGDGIVEVPGSVPDETPILIEVCGDGACGGACIEVSYSRTITDGHRWFFCDCDTWAIYWYGEGG